VSGCLIIPDKETAKARRELFGNSEQLDTISSDADMRGGQDAELDRRDSETSRKT